MVKKKKIKKKKKNSEYKPKFRICNTVWSTIMLGLLLIVGVIIFFSFTISMEMVNSVQANAQINFYENTFSISSQNAVPSLKEYLGEKNINSSEFHSYLLNLKSDINDKLTDKFKVGDIFIVKKASDRLAPVLYTTMNKNNGDKYGIKLGSIVPFKIESSSKYSIDDYTVLPIQLKENKAYRVYLVVPKIIYGEINPQTGERKDYKFILMEQLIKFFSVIVIICIICIYAIVRSITKPLETMEKTVSQIAKGDLSGRLELTKYDEINKLVGSYNMMANALQRLYSSLEAQVNDRTRELKGAYAELQNTQAMMVHSEKMKSLGELVAGIMHEINNPINFIYGNMTHLGNYSKYLIEVIDEYSKYEPSLKDAEKAQITKMKKDCDYDFLRTDMPDLIKSCKEGAERAKNIIQDLKSFSRMEEVSIKDVDLPVEIDTVLNILHNKIKNKAEIHKEYMADVPKVEAFGGQLNQVFMNILDNAVGAMEKNGDIWIRINKDDKTNSLVVEVEDNGAGMDEETQRKVFDPFFTTKPVGKGTGLGMSITYKIIKNHQGDIKVVSKKGKGTKFTITLPLNIDREKLNASVASGDNDGQ